jgi:hypothetical protein
LQLVRWTLLRCCANLGENMHLDNAVKVLFCLLFLSLLGCGEGLGNIPDAELRQRHYRCQMATGLSQAEIQVCKNIKRECELRAKNGNFAC